MPAVSRKSGQDSIATNHGCDATTVTNEGSSKVLVEGYGVVRDGDQCAVHLFPVGIGCGSHVVSLSSYSNKVYADGKGIGRVGDFYNGHSLTTGSSKVIAG